MEQRPQVRHEQHENHKEFRRRRPVGGGDDSGAADPRIAADAIVLAVLGRRSLPGRVARTIVGPGTGLKRLGRRSRSVRLLQVEGLLARPHVAGLPTVGGVVVPLSRVAQAGALLRDDRAQHDATSAQEDADPAEVELST